MSCRGDSKNALSLRQILGGGNCAVADWRRLEVGCVAGNSRNIMILLNKLFWHKTCEITGQEHYSQKGEDMKKLTAAASMVVMSLALGGCASNPSNAQIGAATGAVVGGVVGSALTGGSTFGTVGGAGAGAAAGYEIGKRMK